MTTPYGVTKFGAREQILDLIRRGDLELPVDNPGPYCSYISEKILQGVTEVVSSASSVMGWLQECVKIILTEHPTRDIVWYPPSGLRVIQRYKKRKVKRLATVHGKVMYKCSIGKEERGVEPNTNSRKSVSGIAPNFIHSLDSSHLMLTVIGANKFDGLQDFSLIHDSFGTHSSSVEVLSKRLRTEFVEMYKGRDILDNLRDYWQYEYEVSLPMWPTIVTGKHESARSPVTHQTY